MVDPKVVHASLELLDRQLVDADGVLCGKVDDLELDEGPDGALYVTHLLCGPGVLLRRAGFGRLGDWLQRSTEAAYPWRADPARIPLEQVAELGNHISLTSDHRDLATFAGERWVRDHVIGSIPGAATMRMGDLLHSEVVDKDGVSVGRVHDLRLVQDGPKVRGFGAALRVDGLVVGHGSLAIRLGYHRQDVRGPFLLGRLFRGLEGRATYVPWDTVASHDGELRLIAALADLPKVRDLG